MIFLTLLLGVVSSAGLQAKAGGGDREQIQVLVENYVEAYNQGDEAALEKLWAEDGDLISRPGKALSKGKQGILMEIKNNQTREYQGGKMDLRISNIKFVGKNAALVEAKNLLTGVISPGGTKLPPIPHYMIFLVEKDKKDWRINAIRYFSAIPIVRSSRSP